MTYRLTIEPLGQFIEVEDGQTLLDASLRAGTPEQQHWLAMIRDHIAANLGINLDDFEYAPFNKEGGLGRVHQLFGERLPQVIEVLNRELVA